MTRDQQRELIRRKCIEANPEIQTYRSPCQCKDHGNCPFADHARVGRPIRLADVLCVAEARTHKEVEGGNPEEQAESFETFRRDIFANVCVEWDIYHDDLTQQSDECVAFLAQLLG
jgi:hypothetical protein